MSVEVAGSSPAPPRYFVRALASHGGVGYRIAFYNLTTLQRKRLLRLTGSRASCGARDTVAGAVRWGGTSLALLSHGGELLVRHGTSALAGGA